MKTGFLIFALTVLFVFSKGQQIGENFEERSTANLTTCHWINNRTCPDHEIRFYLYTRDNVDERQLINIDDTWESSNLSSSFFNPQKPSKIIIHGFRADMFLTPLFNMKTEYLKRGEHNIFYVDWYNLSSTPVVCYPAVVHNIKHVGKCSAQLVNRIRDAGGVDIHVIGFSLGAQVANYVANSLKPDYVLPRITDPAFPLFVTGDKENKLDSTDAKFVDVFHCNGLMQGQIERCGAVDFYMNGGVYQPGCGRDIFSCSHHRCPNYFTESIRSAEGFYGWKCQSYFHYLLGLCPFAAGDMLLAGENCDVTSSRGVYLVKTNSEYPFAMGRPQDDARARLWNDDGLKIQREALNIVRENIEHGEFMSNYDGDKESYEKFLEKLAVVNHRNPKVLSINRT